MKRGDKPCILVVEDDPSVRALTADALRRLGHVIEAGDGETALELLRTHNPQLVCLDLALPQMSGFAVCTTVRKSGMATRVLIISGRTSLGDRVQTQEVGADDFLSKPFRARDLIERARRWIEVAQADRAAVNAGSSVQSFDSPISASEGVSEVST